MAETTVSDRMATRPVGHADTLGARMTALRHGMSPWWFLLPAVLFFVGYQAYPIFRVLWISFTDYQYLSSEPAHFVGFNNYAAALTISRKLQYLALIAENLLDMAKVEASIRALNLGEVHRIDADARVLDQ